VSEADDILAKLRSSSNRAPPLSAPSVLSKLRDAPDPAPQTEQPQQSIWDSFKSLISRSGEAIASSGEDLARGAKEVGRDTLQMASDVGQSLMPTQAGAQAGGRVVSKVGDIGQFASGGLTGPIGPQGTAAAMRPGMEAPPRPGMLPMPMRREPAPKLEPAIPADAEKGEPSMFANAIARNDPTDIDRALTKRFRQAMGTGVPRQQRSFAGIMAQDQKITTAVDSLIDAKDSLKFTTPEGRELPAGRLPRTLGEFSQGIAHLKSQIFQQYDQMAGDASVRVPMQPAAQHLRQLAEEIPMKILGTNKPKEASTVSQSLLNQAARLEQYGALKPREAQSLMRTLNNEYGGQKSEGSATYKDAMIQSSNIIRNTLNQTMDQGLAGQPQYSALRNKYGALSSIEEDVAKAVAKQLKDKPTYFDKSVHVGSALGLLQTAIFHNVYGAAAGLTAEGVRALQRYLNSPNRAVSKMFSNRAESTPRQIQQAIMERNSLLGDRYNAARTSNLDEYNSLGNKLRDIGM
jgi:hypothetical protein